MENASHVKRVPDAFGTAWHRAQKETRAILSPGLPPRGQSTGCWYE
jgi:hypothetical protein